MSSPVVVLPYSPDWASQFLELKKLIWPTVQDFALSIEHVGSTSVPGLAAKPVIDIDIVIPGHVDATTTAITNSYMSGNYAAPAETIQRIVGHSLRSLPNLSWTQAPTRVLTSASGAIKVEVFDAVSDSKFRMNYSPIDKHFVNDAPKSSSSLSQLTRSCRSLVN